MRAPNGYMIHSKRWMRAIPAKIITALKTIAAVTHHASTRRWFSAGIWSSENTITKTKMLSTDNDSSSRYAAWYSAAAVAPRATATHAPKARATPIQKATRITFPDATDGTPGLAFVAAITAPAPAARPRKGTRGHPRDCVTYELSFPLSLSFSLVGRATAYRRLNVNHNLPRLGVRQNVLLQLGNRLLLACPGVPRALHHGFQVLI